MPSSGAERSERVGRERKELSVSGILNFEKSCIAQKFLSSGFPQLPAPGSHTGSLYLSSAQHFTKIESRRVFYCRGATNICDSTVWR